jgi:AcrR family transcriptional regulator
MDDAVTAARSARPKKRASYHHGDLRRALLASSTALIAEQGADAFTLREAARRVGVSHAAAYRHFADKETVLAAIAEQGYRELAQRLREVVESVPRRSIDRRMLAVVTAYVAFASEQPARFAVMTRARRDERRSPELGAAIDGALGVLVSVMAEGIEAGLLTRCAPIDHAMRLYVFAYGYAALVLRQRVRVRPSHVESYLATLLGPMLAAMRPPK